MPVKEFEETITNFIRQLKITDNGIEMLKKAILEEWNNRIANHQKDSSSLENKILELKAQSKMIAQKNPVFNLSCGNQALGKTIRRY